MHAMGLPGSDTLAGSVRIAAMENLCDRPLFTGYTRDGGYGETPDRADPWELRCSGHEAVTHLDMTQGARR